MTVLLAILAAGRAAGQGQCPNGDLDQRGTQFVLMFPQSDGAWTPQLHNGRRWQA
jgi:hypothetical protein